LDSTPAAAAPAEFAGVTEMVGMAVVARGRRPGWLSLVHVGDSSGELPTAFASGLLSVDVAMEVEPNDSEWVLLGGQPAAVCIRVGSVN